MHQIIQTAKPDCLKDVRLIAGNQQSRSPFTFIICVKISTLVFHKKVDIPNVIMTTIINKKTSIYKKLLIVNVQM